MLYDITRTISSALRVWPGDTPFTLTHVMRLADGDSVNLTTFTTTAHLGTHADAYYHYEADGAHPAAMPLDAYIGKARVVTVSKGDGPLFPADFDHVDLTGAERLLIHSPVSDLPDDQWPETFPYLSVELIAWLAGLGIRLIGLDSPSVDAFTSTDLPCHHALNRHKIVNIETLQLRGVPDGQYELVALPLKLAGACGSPVRAVLRPQAEY
ncbi:MAG: cyclase family protein [Anaerolineaceae bacterium]|nr:cyclase family protein [Anaerolineaceae bacterium]